MNKKTETEQAITNQPIKPGVARPWLMIFCVLAFVVCILLTVTPIARIAHMGAVPRSFIEDVATPAGFVPPRMPFLTVWGLWLPMHITQSTSVIALYLTANLEILALLGLAFTVYLVAAFFIARRAQIDQMAQLRRLMWIGAIVAGLIYVLTPGMASKDLFVYADYGNLVGRHLANPYFTTPSQIAPTDLLTRIDSYSASPSAYGPVWTYLSGFLSLVFGDHLLPYFYSYRLLELVCHLLNAILIGRMLRMAGRSERVVTVGMFLYVWNPLMLFEGPLGAHNDVFMSTLMLFGLMLCFRANKKGFTHFKNYWPGLVVLTLAALVKFTALPVVLFFLFVLAGKTLGTPHAPLRKMPWLSALKNVLLAGLLVVGILLIAYLPFWIGHTPKDIVASFGSPPSSEFSQNSLMRVVTNWLKVYTFRGHAGSLPDRFMHVMASRSFWGKVDVLFMGLAVLAGVWYTWRSPTLRSLVLGSLATMTIILIVTPWFYSWYVVWLVALAPIMMAFTLGRIGRAVIAFCLAFSLTAFVTYLNANFIPWSGYELGVRYVLMIVPPFVVALLVYRHAHTQLRLVIGKDEATPLLVSDVVSSDAVSREA